jgi:predicted secreted protein
MKKVAVRIAAVLAAAGLAVPALACDYMKSTTTSASKKPAVAKASTAKEKAAAKAKPASEAKPATAAN